MDCLLSSSYINYDNSSEFCVKLCTEMSMYMVQALLYGITKYTNNPMRLIGINQAIYEMLFVQVSYLVMA